jgi:peptidyl-prolyl cis-trans isomerase SurA
MTYNLVRRAAVVLSWTLCLVAAARADIIEQILVKVNGEIFTKTDLEAKQVAALRQPGQQLDLKSDPSDRQLRKMLDEVTPGLMVNVIDEMLIVQRGKELGYKLADDQFQTILENIKKENKIDTDERLQEALKQENITLADLRRNLEQQMIVSRVQQNEVFGKIGVSEEEARRYYDAHLNEFTTTPEVTLREILVAVPSDGNTLNVGLDEAAKEKADNIRQRAIAGDSFEKLAADLSDAPSRANAGLIGPISLSDLSPDLRKLMSAMEAGEVSGAIRTPRGYQILKLESSTSAETMPFEKAREQISERVFTDKRKEEFQKYIEKLRSQAIIEWKNQDVRKAYQLGLEQAKAAGAASK